jgi:hypothetical protein
VHFVFDLIFDRPTAQVVWRLPTHASPHDEIAHRFIKLQIRQARFPCGQQCGRYQGNGQGRHDMAHLPHQASAQLRDLGEALLLG